MRENKLREIWKKGGTVVNGWLGIPSSVAAENMAQAGWDSLTVDMQHGLVDYSSAVPMLQAVSTSNSVPLARVPWLEAGIIMKLLDAGAFGIICPMINSRAECEALVGACRYAPRGYRSYGPTRAIWVGGADYWKHANDTVLTIAMIETRQALDNLDDILSVPGLDALYVGPTDLALSLGSTPTLVSEDPKVIDAIKAIAAAGQRHGVVPGIHTASPEHAKQLMGFGYRFVTLLSDNAFLNAAARNAVAAMRESPAVAGGGSPY